MRLAEVTAPTDHKVGKFFLYYGSVQTDFEGAQAAVNPIAWTFKDDAYFAAP